MTSSSVGDPTAANGPAAYNRPTAVNADNDAHGHRHLGLALLVIASAQLMVVLDGSIVNVALPSIQRALDFTPANLTWVINGYTLAFGGLLLLGGRAGDLFGRRRVFVFGILLFSLASLLCGFATGEVTLVAFRILQGLGAAIAAPTALALVTTTFPEGPARNRAFAVYAAMSGAGAAVGLIAGGVLTDYANWRWVFFVNVPIGLLIAFAAPRVLGESSPEPGKIDILGAVSGTVGLTVLVYGITRTSAHGWGDTVTIACFALAVVMLVAFVLIESRLAHPILPLRLFRNRVRAGSYMVMLVVGASLFSMFYFISLFVQGTLQYSPIRAGMAFLPFTVGIVAGAGIATQLAARAAPRAIAGTGLALAAVGLFGFSRLGVDSTYYPDLLLPMIITALGMGLTFVPLTLTAVSDVGAEDAGIASAVLNTMQQVGGSLGLAILATVSANATTARFAAADDVNAAARAAAAGAPGVQMPDQGLLAQATEAFTHGYASAFLVGAFMLAAAVVLVLALVDAPRQQVPTDGPAVHVG